MTTRGVIYYNVGTSCVIRILVSLHSLRKHYGGPVTICSEGIDSQKLFDQLDLTSLNATVKNVDHVVAAVPPGPMATYLKTTLAVHMTPYDTTIWLDADTLVRGKIDELFDLAEKHEICVPQFADWTSSGRTISKRIKSWTPYYPEHIEKALACGYATNCGVLAFTKNSQWMHDWYQKTLPGRDIYICNETVQNTLIHLYPHIIIDQKFNCSCRYSKPKAPDTRVIHFHGRKHCRIGLPYSGDLWYSEYCELTKDNIANINEITPAGDRQLRNYLNNLPKPVSVNELTTEAKFDPTKADPTSKQFTLVTAVTPNYLEKLKLTAPTWVWKPQFKGAPLLVYANGFDDPEETLDFLYELFDEVTIIDWTMPKYDSQRELMLSAFVLGAPFEVKTPYWVKIDCDAFFFNNQQVFTDEHFGYDIAGSKWHYSKPGRWLNDLDDWADKNNIPGKRYLKPEQVAEAVASGRFGHNRFASWICLHKTDFTIEAAKLAGNRLPIPSHDTYLWYMAERLPHRKWARHKFKKCGTSNSTDIEIIRERIKNKA